MTISKANHKMFLFSLFYPAVNGVAQERRFPLEKINDASSCLKKIKENAQEIPKGGGLVGYEWSEDAVEFTDDEVKVLRDLVGGVKEIAPSQLEMLNELKEILQ